MRVVLHYFTYLRFTYEDSEKNRHGDGNHSLQMTETWLYVVICSVLLWWQCISPSLLLVCNSCIFSLQSLPLLRKFRV